MNGVLVECLGDFSKLRFHRKHVENKHFALSDLNSFESNVNILARNAHFFLNGQFGQSSLEFLRFF